MIKHKRPQDHWTKADMRKPWWLIATWFGCGLSPITSGTVGSLGALPFAYILQRIGGNTLLFAAAIGIFILGTWASNQYLKHSNRADDPSEIVVDEVAGQWLLLAFLPFTWQGYLVGFVLFRSFDIVKPWPVSVADQKIKGGFGIMFDDIAAALYPIILYTLLSCFGATELLEEFNRFVGY